jgi:hypothetical protein
MVTTECNVETTASQADLMLRLELAEPGRTTRRSGRAAAIKPEYW